MTGPRRRLHIPDPDAGMSLRGPRLRILPLCRVTTKAFAGSAEAATCPACQEARARALQAPERPVTPGGVVIRPSAPQVHLRNVYAAAGGLCGAPAGPFATYPSETTCAACQVALVRKLRFETKRPRQRRRDAGVRHALRGLSATPPLRVRAPLDPPTVSPPCRDGTQAHRRRVCWADGEERGECKLCGHVLVYRKSLEFEHADPLRAGSAFIRARRRAGRGAGAAGGDLYGDERAKERHG